MSALHRLPEEIFISLLDLLPLTSIRNLASTCTTLHKRIHENEYFWCQRLRNEHRVCLLNQDLSGFKYSGIIKDTAMNSKEILFLLSREFYKKAEEERPLVSGLLLTLSSLFKRPSRPFRLALVGPAIEAARTEKIVLKLVNAHDDLFEMVELVPGLSNGIGSGVRIEFKKSIEFDLICLFTNAKEWRGGRQRLLAFSNKLLRKDAVHEGNQHWDRVGKDFPI